MKKKVSRFGNEEMRTDIGNERIADGDLYREQSVKDIMGIIEDSYQNPKDQLQALTTLYHRVEDDNEFEDIEIKKRILKALTLKALVLINEIGDNEENVKVYLNPATPSGDMNDPYNRIYNPTPQMLCPKEMLKWQAMQVVNMYHWFGMPCLVLVDFDMGMIVRTANISYDTIVRAKNDDTLDIVLFTDGKRSTALKKDT